MNQIQQFDQLKADITLKLAPSLDIKVTDKSSMNNALLAGKEANHFKKLVEDKRKELVAPLNDQVKRINDYAKLISEPINKSIDYLKSELSSFERKLEEERMVEQKRLQVEAQKKALELEKEKKEELERHSFAAEFGTVDESDLKRQEIVSNAEFDRKQNDLEKEIKTEEKAVLSNKVSGARKIWKFEVQDLNLVPREYLSIDEKKVREAIQKGITEIPGIRAYQETTIALR